MITYADATPPAGGITVQVTLIDAHRLDARGIVARIRCRARVAARPYR